MDIVHRYVAHLLLGVDDLAAPHMTATTATLNRAQEILADAMSEAELQANVEEMLELFGWRFIHDRDSRRNNPGFPDICAVRRGRLLFAELKTTRGRFRTEQRLWLEDLSAAEVETYVLRPRDWHSGLIEEILR